MALVNSGFESDTPITCADKPSSRGLLPDIVNGFYDSLLINLASIAYSVRDLRAFLMNARLAIDYGYLKPSCFHP